MIPNLPTPPFHLLYDRWAIPSCEVVIGKKQDGTTAKRIIYPWGYRKTGGTVNLIPISVPCHVSYASYGPERDGVFDPSPKSSSTAIIFLPRPSNEKIPGTDYTPLDLVRVNYGFGCSVYDEEVADPAKTKEISSMSYTMGGVAAVYPYHVQIAFRPR